MSFPDFQAEYEYAKALFHTDCPTKEQFDLAAEDLHKNYMEYLYESDETEGNS